MSETELVGAIVLGLTAIGGLVAMIVKPFAKLTQAINDLTVVVKVLTNKVDTTDKLVEKLEKQVILMEKRMTGFEIACAQTRHTHEKNEAL